MYEGDEVEAIEVEVVVRETEKAILIRTYDKDEIWIPKSVIGEYSEVVGKGDSGELLVAQWFYDKELG